MSQEDNLYTYHPVCSSRTRIADHPLFQARTAIPRPFFLGLYDQYRCRALVRRESQIREEMVFFITAQRVVTDRNANVILYLRLVETCLSQRPSVRLSVRHHSCHDVSSFDPHSFLPSFCSLTSCLFSPYPLLSSHPIPCPPSIPPLTSQHQQTPHSRHPPNPPSKP